MNNPPIHLSVRRMMGDFVYKTHDNGDEFIACKYGRIEAVNKPDTCYYAAVLVDPPPAVWRRMQKLKLPVEWKRENPVEICYELVPGNVTRAIGIMKPLKPRKGTRQ